MAKYRFEQIAINSKEKKKPAEEDRFTYIGLEHLDTGSLNVTRFGSDVAPIGEKLVMRKGDVLFGKRRAYQKKVAIAPFDGIFSAHGMVLRPQEKVVDRKFFPLFISSDYFLDAAIKISVGSLSPTINWRDLKDLEFELPDLDMQKELAEVLWAINDTIESYKKLISVTDELVKSQFIEITQSGDRTPTRMGDIATYVNGYAFKPQDWSFEGVPIIRIQNLNDPSADFNRFTGEIDEKYLVHNGDVLVSWATHLEAYLWNGGDAWLNQHIFKVVFDKRKVNKVFFIFAANYALKEAFKKAHGFKATMEHIKRGDFEDAIVMMPDLFQQEEFATLVRQSDKSKFAVLNCLKRNLLLILQKTEDVHSLINQSAKSISVKAVTGRIIMDRERYLILINGQDKTDSVKEFRPCGDACDIIYTSSPQVYHYQGGKVKILELQQRIDPAGLIVTVKGVCMTQVDMILDFGPYYRLVCSGKKTLSYPREEVEIQHNCLTEDSQKCIFDYFKETAGAVSLVVGNDINILSMQYERIQTVSEETVLACYLELGRQPKTAPLPETVIYPFGLNQSQKVAVENALSSQISIIQGPPGTGKTQTILNIIANAVRNRKTVAVVSNNNSATLNVAEKLEKKGLSFLTAFLGSISNKECFLEAQTGRYPDMGEWTLGQKGKTLLNQEVTALSKELNDMLNAKNRIAEIKQEFLQLRPEQYYFDEYYQTYAQAPQENLKRLSSQQILNLWLEYEQHAERESRLGLLKKISIMFRFNLSALKIFLQSPELVIPYLQRQFYVVRQRELTEERIQLEQRLTNYSFSEKMEELTEKSLRLFRAELSNTYQWKEERRTFEMRDFRGRSNEFNREYPVVLSTTYSIKGTLNIDHIYDYLIVDEASQVDLATGVLAFACARNIVIVGDLQQLPNVLNDRDIQTSEAIWNRYSLPEVYHFSAHSLLSSALAAWPKAPTVLLREHYRCHPKIINFCNQKFYGGKLIVMTADHDEPDVLTMYRTAPGNHARGRLNQREIDVIQKEVLPHLQEKGYRSIGVITPYRDQVAALQSQLGGGIEAVTVHKFQGREKDAIVLTSVDNVITEFVDDPRMLNVAVSRAVKSLTVVTSQDPRNDQTNYGDLARYIEYNNCAVVESAVYSIFDLLYQGYAQQRCVFLQKHRRISEYDSENLLYAVIERVLMEPEFSAVSSAVHVSLVNLVKDYSLLNHEETAYARNPLTHVDFLLFRKMDKSPLLAIEVDGTAFHAASSVQAMRDEKKNHILSQYGIPLLRLKTDGSDEKKQIEQALRTAL